MSPETGQMPADDERYDSRRYRSQVSNRTHSSRVAETESPLYITQRWRSAMELWGMCSHRLPTTYLSVHFRAAQSLTATLRGCFSKFNVLFRVIFGRPFVKQFARCYRTVVLSVLSALSVCDVGVLWPNGWTDQDETWPPSWPHSWRISTAPPVFGSSVVVNRLHRLRCHLVWR